MHDTYIGGRSENNIKCILHDDLGWKNSLLQVFCCVTGFTSDFLSFIVVEHIQYRTFTEPFQYYCKNVVSDSANNDYDAQGDELLRQTFAL